MAPALPIVIILTEKWKILPFRMDYGNVVSAHLFRSSSQLFFTA
jgi:hypothetical protein